MVKDKKTGSDEVEKARTTTDISLNNADIETLSDRLGDGEWYADERRRAWSVYETIPMPTVEEEAWRRTDIRAIPWEEMRPEGLRDNSEERENTERVPELLKRPLAGNKQGGRIVVSGGTTEDRIVSDEVVGQGIIFSDLLNATREHSATVEKYLGRLVKMGDGKHAAMAGALADQGVVVYVPRNVSITEPLHSVIWANRRTQFSRVLVILEEGASLTYVHELGSSSTEDQRLHAGTVEVFVGDGANLTFVELQTLGDEFAHFSHERAQVGRDGVLDWIFCSVGSKLTKTFLDLDLYGRGARGRMSGFYFAAGDQHLDHDTQQNHLAEDQVSDLLFKGALRDESRSVWQGMINVAPGAQKADGFQANRNILLGSEARADSIPGLEIQADDVRCTHAATVGKLEDEHMFYLMSRGMDYEDARKLIVDGFFDPIMQRIPFEGVRERLKDIVVGKME